MFLLSHHSPNENLFAQLKLKCRLIKVIKHAFEGSHTESRKEKSDQN